MYRHFSFLSSADYCASKAAVIALHESLTYELRKHYHTPDIRTTLVIPSHIKTPMFSEIHFPKWGGLFPFLAPTLEPMDVADAIIGRLDKRENGTLRLPLYSHLGRVLGLAAEIIPGWARDLARWVSDTYGVPSNRRLTLCFLLNRQPSRMHL